MKKIKLLSIASSMLIGSSLLINAPVAVASGVMSATGCESANLNQALQGMGWSQEGVKNNGTSPFFVVCPINWDFGDTINEVGLRGFFPGSTGEIECTVRAQAFDGSYETAALTVINDGSGRATAWTGAVLTSVTGAANTTVVCALESGEGINGYWTLPT